MGDLWNASFGLADQSYTAVNRSFLLLNETLIAANESFVASNESFLASSGGLVASTASFLTSNESFLMQNRHMMAPNETFEPPNGNNSNTTANTLSAEELCVRNGTPHIVSSDVESVALYLYVGCINAFIFIANTAVLTTVARYERFHTAQYSFLVAYVTCDLLMNLSTLTSAILTSIMEAETPDSTCWINVLTVGVFFAGIYMTALIAWERYMYFCHPMSYPRVLTKVKTCVILGVCFSVCFTYSVTSQIVIGRTVHLSILMCQLPVPAQITIQSILFFGPAIFCTIFSVTSIALTARRLQVAPQDVAGSSQQQETGKSKRLSMRAAIRMILLVSGAFWGTYIPPWAIRSLLLYSGFTWEHFDNRCHINAAILLRAMTFIMNHASSALNPVIYFAIHKDLLVGFKRLLGYHVHFSAEGNGNNSTVVSIDLPEQ